MGKAYAQQKDWEKALEVFERCARIQPADPKNHLLRAQALEQVGRLTGAELARARADELGPQRDQRREELFERAKAAEESEPQVALDLGKAALSLSDPQRHADAVELARFTAKLLESAAERLGLLAPVLVLPGKQLADRADAVLAPAWLKPLEKRARRLFELDARDQGAGSSLTMALAACYDQMLGAQDPARVNLALRHAERAVAAAPASLTAHLSRAYLRLHSGDPLRSLRELKMLEEIAAESALYHFVLAEAAAAGGQPERSAQALAKARELGLPRADERVANSRYVKGS